MAKKVKAVAKRIKRIAKKRLSSKPKSPIGKRKVKIVMDEFKAGDLKSGSGALVTNPKQAIAIALSEQRKSDAATRKKRKR